MTSRLREKLENGQRPVMVSLHTAGMLFTETVGHQDLDAVMLDMQHGAFDYAGAYGMLTALGGTGATPVVRVEWNDPATIMKVLDAGAQGIVCPLVETAEEAARFVAACRYPPEGIRSIGPNRAGLAPGYLDGANRDVLTIALVETRRGYESIDQIAATPGLDAVMVGSGDLAASMDGTLRLDSSKPEVVERRRVMIESAHAHGLWAVCATSGRSPQGDFEAGADLVVLSDNSIVKPALKRALADAREWMAVASAA